MPRIDDFKGKKIVLEEIECPVVEVNGKFLAIYENQNIGAIISYAGDIYEDAVTGIHAAKQVISPKDSLSGFYEGITYDLLKKKLNDFYSLEKKARKASSQHREPTRRSNPTIDELANLNHVSVRINYEDCDIVRVENLPCAVAIYKEGTTIHGFTGELYGSEGNYSANPISVSPGGKFKKTVFQNGSMEQREVPYDTLNKLLQAAANKK
ncbi:hypothetical protein JXC34_02965 [Candidatus Woesearchaeota archaeon]|nr:hypothetical protein [Candidatus Woesearchaeota archaeon]